MLSPSAKNKKIKLDFFAEGLEVRGRGRAKRLNFFIVAADDNKDRSSVMKLAASIFPPPSIVFTPRHGISSPGARTGWTRRVVSAEVVMPGSTGLPNAEPRQRYRPPSSPNFRRSREIGQDCTRQFLFR